MKTLFIRGKYSENIFNTKERSSLYVALSQYQFSPHIDSYQSRMPMVFNVTDLCPPASYIRLPFKQAHRENEKVLFKLDLTSYIPCAGFPASNPAVYELYWSPSQVLARAHPNLLKTQRFLMSHWNTISKESMISTSHPATYADRLRIRQPGDEGFALGPHIDGGSCERWEAEGYGRGHVYDSIFTGNWQSYDPWESSCRLPVVSDLYNGAGACSMFRMFQGWLSMSETQAGEGTLMVNPLLEKATAYMLLRPFFRPISSLRNGFLEASNWVLENEMTPVLQGAVPSSCQELTEVVQPHWALSTTMVHIPKIRPGDYIAWHCDSECPISEKSMRKEH